MITDERIRQFASQAGLEFEYGRLLHDECSIEIFDNIRRYTRILSDYMLNPMIFRRDKDRSGIHASGGWIIDPSILEIISENTIESGFGCSMEEVEAVLLSLEKFPSNVDHDSDCAVHNMPAYPNGLCNCAASVRLQQAEENTLQMFIDIDRQKTFEINVLTKENRKLYDEINRLKCTGLQEIGSADKSYSGSDDALSIFKNQQSGI